MIQTLCSLWYTMIIVVILVRNNMAWYYTCNYILCTVRLICTWYKLFLSVRWTVNESLMICATNGTGRSANPSGAAEFTPVFGEIHVTKSLGFCVVFCWPCFCPSIQWPKNRTDNTMAKRQKYMYVVHSNALNMFI
jgi:hypothetical protein